MPPAIQEGPVAKRTYTVIKDFFDNKAGRMVRAGTALEIEKDEAEARKDLFLENQKARPEEDK